MSRSFRTLAPVAVAVAVAGALLALPGPVAARTPRARTLLVGSYRGQRGAFRTIQSAVDAARSGDVILVGPGVYHERADRGSHSVAGGEEAGAGVFIDTPGITLRGLDRNRVIVDGTRPGPGPACSASRSRQDFGPHGKDGKALGRNGVEVFKAGNVTIENLTVCNFLKGNGDGGNEVWFNNGDGSGKSLPGRFLGAWLSATSSFYQASGARAASYGLFASNSQGPGVFAHTYASNMDDSSYYVGACRNCNTVITDAHAQYSALGYSGTNSGGRLRIENSEWDHNKSGIVSNSQNNDDAPSPQLGWCPQSTTRSCTVYRGNRIHDNNNPNVPGAGSASFGAIGTGLTIAGGRGNTIRDNRIYRNGAWGVVTTPYPDDEDPPPISNCEGGLPNFSAVGLTFKCYYDNWGNQVLNNKFSGNGFFANPSNGDLADLSMANDPGNCWRGNTNPAGVTSAPENLQVTHARCGVPNSGAAIGSPLSLQLICNTELLGPCDPSSGNYPRKTKVVMPGLRPQVSMPDPCRGAPANAWCERIGFTGSRRG
jgi:hypothetical protein